MTSRRFRWTRERYYKAQHLNRLLPQLASTVEPPRLVRLLHQLHDRTPGIHGTDPLTRSLSERRWDRDRSFDPDIPF